MIDPRDFTFEYFQSSGPGGQNVNKVATAVRLRFDLMQSESISEEVKGRMARLAGKKMTSEGILLIEARRYRTRERNQQDALERFYKLLDRAHKIQRPRKATKPPRTSVERRLTEKKRHSTKKYGRKPYDFED